MISLGKSFFSEPDSVKYYTPIQQKNINNISIGYSLFDDLFITSDLTTDVISDSWGKHTLIHATFDGDTIAGNMNWLLNNISCLLLKRKEYDSYLWMTLHKQEVSKVEDFNFEYKDYFAKSNKRYMYAIVPIFRNTGEEGEYIIASQVNDKNNQYIDAKFDCLTIYEDEDNVYSTILETGSCDTTRNQKVGIVEMKNKAKPKIFVNSRVNYNTGSVSGLFVALKEDGSYDFENSTDYRSKVIDCFTNGKTKYVKTDDGRAWICEFNGNPTDSMNGAKEKRLISCNWIEVGDADSEKDLYENGLINVGKDFWSKYYNS